MSIWKIAALAGLLLSTAAWGSGLDEYSSDRYKNGWVGSTEEMQEKNAFLSAEFQPPAKASSEKEATAPGHPAANAGGEEQGISASQISGNEQTAFENAKGDKMKYPIPCNEDDGLYIVDYRNSPPCDLTYPSIGVNSADIQPLRTLSGNEIAERAQRPRLIHGDTNDDWSLVISQQ